MYISKKPLPVQKGRGLFVCRCFCNDYMCHCFTCTLTVLLGSVFFLSDTNSLDITFYHPSSVTLPFSLSSKPRSIKDGVMRLIIRSDLPMCLAISVCFASGFSLRKRNTANSSKEQSKEPFWHFETSLLALWDSRTSILLLLSTFYSPKIRFLKNNSR